MLVQIIDDVADAILFTNLPGKDYKKLNAGLRIRLHKTDNHSSNIEELLIKFG